MASAFLALVAFNHWPTLASHKHVRHIHVLTPDITLDPGFKNFYFWCKENGIPFVIVSR
jgi:2-hydroxy-3-keto-5-methylthiopentenyl-1-phosphate phosphatase